MDRRKDLTEPFSPLYFKRGKIQSDFFSHFYLIGERANHTGDLEMVEEIDKIKKKHQGMWLAIKIVKRDEYGRPIAGELLAEAKTHHELHLKLVDDPDQEVYETYGGKVPTKAVLF